MITSFANKLGLTGFNALNVLFLCLLSASANAVDWVGYDLRGAHCAGKPQGYGPFDYTNPTHRAEKLDIVEQYHFTPQMEANAGVEMEVGGQFDYTLRTFPNHHRALYAAVRHQLRFDDEIYTKGRTSAECYFQRAIAFSPRDIKVHILYAYYLGKKGQDEMAIKEYQKALAIKPQAHLHYQLGKTFLKIKQYEDAAMHARIAIEKGYKKTDLKKQLQAIGKWPKQ